mmetsp:Transcript_18803/g.39099  ORF Transcript_18803/g.39099 Transcript_18803/m.39099 type:complete len:291 (-) Transcript_18803:72-944(-)
MRPTLPTTTTASRLASPRNAPKSEGCRRSRLRQRPPLERRHLRLLRRLQPHRRRPTPPRRHLPPPPHRIRPHPPRRRVQIRWPNDLRLLLPRPRLRHHQRHRPRRHVGGRQGRHRDQGKSHPQHRQGGQSRLHERRDARSGEGDDRGTDHRRHRRRETHRHRRGGVDTHTQFICPQQCDEAIASGITTLYGGGTGPSAGTSATTCTPGPSHVEMMLRATDDLPLNFGFSGKGNTSDPNASLVDVLKSGASGFKLHEDWGTTPSAIDRCLTLADEQDVQITIHMVTLNESG